MLNLLNSLLALVLIQIWCLESQIKVWTLRDWVYNKSVVREDLPPKCLRWLSWETTYIKWHCVWKYSESKRFVCVFLAVLAPSLCGLFFWLQRAGLLSSCGSWLLLSKRGLSCVCGLRGCSSQAPEHGAHSFVTCGLSSCAACGDLPRSGIKPCLLHQQAESLPLSHQETLT